MRQNEGKACFVARCCLPSVKPRCGRTARRCGRRPRPLPGIRDGVICRAPSRPRAAKGRYPARSRSARWPARAGRAANLEDGHALGDIGTQQSALGAMIVGVTVAIAVPMFGQTVEVGSQELPAPPLPLLQQRRPVVESADRRNPRDGWAVRIDEQRLVVVLWSEVCSGFFHVNSPRI